MGFPIVTLGGGIGFTAVQFNVDRDTNPVPSVPGPARADGTPSNPEFRAFCLANQFPLTHRGLEQARDCTNAWRRAAPGERNAALRRETDVVQGLMDMARNGRTPEVRGSAHAELMRIYDHDYALQAPGTGYEPEADRQRAYTAALRTHVSELMKNNRQQYAHGHGQNIEWAYNTAVRDLLLQPESRVSPRDPKVLAWLANNPDPDLLRGFLAEPRLQPLVLALHANAGTRTPTVQGAWDHLAFEVAIDANFGARFRSVRATLRTPDEQNAFDRQVITQLETQLRHERRPEGGRAFTDAEVSARARIMVTQALEAR